MFSLRSFSVSAACALALSLAPSFVPSLASTASADEPSLADWAKQRVEATLVKPLTDLENSRSSFSRVRMPPHERRVRVLQTTATLDKNGHGFVPFAVDVRYGNAEWRENDIIGCAYRGSGDLFVKRGDDFRPAAFLLGKPGDPVANVCVAAPPPPRA